MSMADAQRDLERRLGMSIWEIREKILDLPNDARWNYMKENRISGGLVMLAPSQYPKAPEDFRGDEGHQMTIDEWIQNDLKKIKEART